MPALRADGTEFPVELAIRRLPVPAPPEPPLFLGFVRDITERLRTESELRELAAEQAALHRVRGARRARRAAARGRRRGHRGDRPAARRADGQRHPLRERRLGQPCSAAGTRRASTACRSARPCRLDDADTVAARIHRTGSRRALDSYEGQDRRAGDAAARAGLPLRPSARRSSSRASCGARCSSRASSPSRSRPASSTASPRSPSSTAQALANAEAREELARVARADRRGRRRGAPQASSATCTTAPSSASSRWRSTLRRAAALLDGDPAAAREALSEAAARGSTQALAELRELARGIHPAVLSEHGLAARRWPRWPTARR